MWKRMANVRNSLYKVEKLRKSIILQFLITHKVGVLKVEPLIAHSHRNVLLEGIRL